MCVPKKWEKGDIFAIETNCQTFDKLPLPHVETLDPTPKMRKTSLVFLYLLSCQVYLMASKGKKTSYDKNSCISGTGMYNTQISPLDAEFL
jgi:hypothetical protein